VIEDIDAGGVTCNDAFLCGDEFDVQVLEISLSEL